jgi:hypothetical protein
MLSRDYRDIVGGGLLVAAGAFMALYAMSNYPLGTLRTMGPGMFPTIVGWVLAFFGVLLAISGLFRSGTWPQIPLVTPAIVVASIAAFAMLVRPFGVIPAIVGVTLISCFADLKFRPVTTLVLCVVLSLVAYLIFQVGLRLPMAMFNWPS